jgi:tetratricopeptide (TPR) repeat protein
LALSNLSSGQRRHDAAEHAMRLYLSAGDARGTARAQQYLAAALWLMGRLDESEARSAQALATARACGDAWNVANCLNNQALIESSRGDVRKAHLLNAQALAAFKALGDESWIASMLVNRAELEFADGHPEQAIRSVSESLEIFMSGKNAWYTANAHNNSAAYRIALGDLSAARDSAREALRVGRQVRNEGQIVTALQHLSLLAGLGSDARCAAQLIGYVNAQYTALGMPRETTEQWGYEMLMAALREKLSAEEIAQLAADGAAWSENQAVDEALAVCARRACTR